VVHARHRRAACIPVRGNWGEELRPSRRVTSPSHKQPRWSHRHAVDAPFGHRLDSTREPSLDSYSSSPSIGLRPRRAQYLMKYTGTATPAIRNAATPQAVA